MDRSFDFYQSAAANIGRSGAKSSEKKQRQSIEMMESTSQYTEVFAWGANH
jgi:hypothetical protein